MCTLKASDNTLKKGEDFSPHYSTNTNVILLSNTGVYYKTLMENGIKKFILVETFSEIHSYFFQNMHLHGLLRSPGMHGFQKQYALK